ncbi:TonB-dependent receptor [Pseudoalteromonas mariniglutinosa]|uniref:TonB-dependent receptor n=1 Tax=Pseudoalteromonas mariniglutinosa TaxID=206042 RepID=UPI0038510030
MNMKFSTLSLAIKKSIIPTLIVSASASTLAANDEDTKKLSKDDIERIEVKSYAASLEKSINMKRFANSVVDAVSAEDIGKFPDQTVADALQRIPGVQVEKDLGGESDRVSIRGTAPHLNITLLNGQSVASATASASITRPSRGFNYSLLPAELVDTLEVYKSAEADIDEGSIGGTVVVKTRKPLNSEANYAALSVKAFHFENADETKPYVSGLYSWKNEASNFGLNLGFVHKESATQRDSKEVRFGYRSTDANADGNAEFYPGAVGYNRYASDSELDTATATFQYAPADNLEILFTNLYSKSSHQSFGTYSSGFILQNIANITDAAITDGSVVSGYLPTHNNLGYYGNAGYQGEFKTQAHDLKVTYERDNYTLTTQLGYSKADGEVSDVYSEYYANTDASFSLNNGTPEVVLSPDLTPEDYRLDYNHKNDITNDSDEKYIQVDFEYKLDNEYFSAIKTGLKYRSHGKSAGLIKANYPKKQTNGDVYNLGQFATTTVSDFLGGENNAILWDFDNSKYSDFINSTTPSTAPYEHLDYTYDLEEKITAAYVKATFNFNKLRGNLGVRAVKTDLDSQSIQYTGRSFAPENIEPIDISSSYEDFLPSININYDLMDDVIIRFAAAKVMSRPDYDFLSARKSGYCSAAAGCRGTEGNPDLKPYRATQYDLSGEWYFNESSILSLAYFYKEIDSYITNTTVEKDWLWTDPETGIEEQRLFLVTQPQNGLGGENAGFEINYTQKLGYGFGVQANYTYSDAELEQTPEQIAAGEEAVLPNNSEDTYNATVYYENNGLSARVSYTYRSEYFYTTYLNLNQYKDGFGQYDLNISYHVTDDINLIFQAINLTNEEQRAISGNNTGMADSNRPLAIHDYGRRFLVGAQIKF